MVCKDILPLVQCIESYLGFSPKILPYYEIEAPLSIPKDLNMLCLDCSSHTIHIRFDSDVKLVCKPNKYFLLLSGIRVPSNSNFEIIQDQHLVFHGKTPPSNLSFGHILLWFDLDGMLQVRWWPHDTEPANGVWATIRNDEMQMITLFQKCQ